MKIAIGNDHGGVELKQHLVQYLEEKGYEVVNFGSDVTDSTDYPIYAERVSKAVVSGECEKGILICGTGIGISISANKIHGVRCALCSEPVSAALARQHNDANIVAMGARTIGPVMAEGIVDVFLNTEFQGGRHQRRVDKIMMLDRGESVQ
ncbi:MAG: ribose 5-phosphate isomerase B [Clostridia bacterium]|nr:ribose 5-phosphate isomerase B [Clostridia bacterium]